MIFTVNYCFSGKHTRVVLILLFRKRIDAIDEQFRFNDQFVFISIINKDVVIG